MDKLQLIALCRQRALNADHNQEDALLIALTRREIWLVMYGLLWAAGLEPRLERGTEDLLEKVSMLLDVQKSHWARGDGEEAA